MYFSNRFAVYSSIRNGMLGLKVDCCSYRLSWSAMMKATSLCMPMYNTWRMVSMEMSSGLS